MSSIIWTAYTAVLCMAFLLNVCFATRREILLEFNSLPVQNTTLLTNIDTHYIEMSRLPRYADSYFFGMEGGIYFEYEDDGNQCSWDLLYGIAAYPVHALYRMKTTAADITNSVTHELQDANAGQQSKNAAAASTSTYLTSQGAPPIWWDAVVSMMSLIATIAGVIIAFLSYKHMKTAKQRNRKTGRTKPPKKKKIRDKLSDHRYRRKGLYKIPGPTGELDAERNEGGHKQVHLRQKDKSGKRRLSV